HGRPADEASNVRPRARRGSARGARLGLARLMRVLVVNAGSSSLRLRLLDADDSVVAEEHLEDWNGDEAAAAEWIGARSQVDAVGHRVVHGGATLQKAAIVDDAVMARIEELTPLAPLHQPRALSGIRMTSVALPGVPTVAC